MHAALGIAVFLSFYQGDQRYHRVRPPLDGVTPAVAITASFWITPRYALEGEVVLGRVLAKPQAFEYNWRVDYTLEHRDVLASVLLRTRLGPSPIEAVAGGGLAFTQTAERDPVKQFPGQPPTRLTDVAKSQVALTLTAGADAAVRAGRRIEIIPSVRLRWIDRPAASLSWLDGVGSYVFQVGAGVRWRP